MGLLEAGPLNKSNAIDTLVLDGAKRETIRRTINMLAESGRIDVDKNTGLISITAPGLEAKERVNLERDKIKYQQEAKTYKKLYEEAQQTAILQEALEEAITMGCNRFKPVAPIPMEMPDIHTTKEMACLHVGDWHAGEVVSLADTGGIGQYNAGIMAARAQILGESVIDLRSHLQGYSLPALAVFMLGDMVSTNIHSILANAGITAVDSLFLCANVIGQLIIDIARYFDIHVFTVPGNHGRLTDDIQYKNQHANWDNLLYHMLRIMLENQENVHFNISKSPFTLVRLNGWRWLLYHGGNIRTWAGIPYYGITRAFHSIRTLLSEKAPKGGQREYAVNKLEEAEKKSERYEYLLTNQGDQDEINDLETFLLSCTRDFMDMLQQCGEVAFDYVAMGHFHSRNTLELGAELFMNGSAIGPTDYVVGKMFHGCRPSHWLHGIHHKRGATWRYPVMLDAVPEDMDMRYKTNMEVEMESMWMQGEVCVNV